MTACEIVSAPDTPTIPTSKNTACAIIAVAAVVEKDKSIRAGVGGMAGRPMVRLITGDAAGAIDAWAEELEGYEDLHASAALRRDLFKKLGPHVIAQATGGKA